MAFQLESGIIVHRDDENNIRELIHSHKNYYSSSLNEPTPREIAEEYLREAAPHFGFEEYKTSRLFEKVSGNFNDEQEELRFSKEKKVGSIAIVTFEQSINGLPVWNSDVSVRVHVNRSAVISSLNESHYGISVEGFDSFGANFTADELSQDILAEILQVKENNLEVHSARNLIYKFLLEDRLDHTHGEELESSGLQSLQKPPSLNLPDLEEGKYVDGKYYVVTEVLFSADAEGYGNLNWIAFIDSASGDVLYLRSSVAQISGSVFAIDPTTQGCSTCTGASSNAELNKYVSQIPLSGLIAPVKNLQSLTGNYVQLKDLQPPTIAPPTKPAGDDFIYEPDDNGFAAVNAYYHCDLFFRYVASLGIDVATYFAGTTFPIQVDARGKNNAVNASCGGNATRTGIGQVLFGIVENGHTLGIASALRVVLHEFGHGLLWNHVGSPNFGFAHSAGDSMACIYADPSNEYADKGLTFPFMFNSGSGISRRNDRTVAQGWAWFGPHWNTQYSGEQVLSSTLYRAYLSAGGGSDNLAFKQFASQYMFYLIVQSCGLLTQTTNDPKVYANALIQADMNPEDFMDATGQTGGTNYKIIRWSFMEQGLYQPPNTPKPITTIGQPPDVDIYINDGRDGTYEWIDDWQQSSDIWNRLSPDGGDENQDPRYGVTNYLYVRLSNRGTQTATQTTTIKGYQSNKESSYDWPADWDALTTAQMQDSGPIGSGQSSIVGPFQWNPEIDSTNAILMVASNPDDPSILDNVAIQGKVLGNWRLVPTDNNIAQRNFTDVVA